jgi:vacuolar protein sorting-associated protein VTA1
MAAVTFLDVLQIWPPVSPEVITKRRFAKFHAARIAKALAAGEDPNLSNPEPDPAPPDEPPYLDPNDPEVIALNANQPTNGGARTLRQPSPEEVPGAHDQVSSQLAPSSNLDQAIHPSRSSSIPRPLYPDQPSPQRSDPAERYYQTGSNGNVSPLEPSIEGDTTSFGGGDFPRLLDDSTNHGPVLPEAPAFEPDQLLNSNLPDFPTTPAPTITDSPNTNLHKTPPTRQAPHFHQPQLPSATSYSTPQRPLPNLASAQPIVSSSIHQTEPTPPTNFVINEESVAKAQKHARWAISALNFEDVDTAIRELQEALKTLGAA